MAILVISHGLPSDTLAVEILLEIFIEPLVAISHIQSKARTLAAVY